MNRVGEKIKSLRIEQGMSAKQLGKKLGVSEGFINEVEQGRRVINEALIERISKVLGKNINDITMAFEEQTYEEEPQDSRAAKSLPSFDKQIPGQNNKRGNEEVKPLWGEAFGQVLKEVPVLKYNLSEKVGIVLMPLQSNKIEGYAQDKVFYLSIEDEDMSGFRIMPGDIALSHITGEVTNNTICLIEHNGERKLRQIKVLDSSKVLLLSNRGSLRTETLSIKDFKVIARLMRVQFNL